MIQMLKLIFVKLVCKLTQLICLTIRIVTKRTTKQDQTTNPMERNRHWRDGRRSMERVYTKYSDTFVRIYVKNLDDSYDTEHRVKKLFRYYGDVTDVRLLKNRYGQSTGVAYVTFAEHHMALKACQLLDGMRNGYGKRIFVDRAFTPKER